MTCKALQTVHITYFHGAQLRVAVRWNTTEGPYSPQLWERIAALRSVQQAINDELKNITPCVWEVCRYIDSAMGEWRYKRMCVAAGHDERACL